MPVNPGVEYVKAEEKYRNASTTQEKLLALSEMMKTVPKHKGTENLRREITRKIAKLRKDVEKEKAQASKAGRGPSINVKKSGAGQIVLVGMPNSGKSTLLKKLTGIKVEIASYPLTTQKPEVGTMNYNGALVQLVEIPALIEGSSEGKAQGTQLLSLIRNADAIVLVVNGKEEEKILLNELRKADIIAGQKKPLIEIKASKFRGITITGKKYLKVKEQDVRDMLKQFGVFNVSVLLMEPTTIEKIAQVLNEKIVYKNSLTVERGKHYGIEELKEKIFLLLEKIIVFTKKPGHEADLKEPLVLKKGSTVEEVAKTVHKDFLENLRYVRVWGSSKFPGQRVAREYGLKNKDIIEIYS